MKNNSHERKVFLSFQSIMTLMNRLEASVRRPLRPYYPGEHIPLTKAYYLPSVRSSVPTLLPGSNPLSALNNPVHSPCSAAGGVPGKILSVTSYYLTFINFPANKFPSVLIRLKFIYSRLHTSSKTDSWIVLLWSSPNSRFYTLGSRSSCFDHHSAYEVTRGIRSTY